jgi:hypothetical protein
MLILLDYRRRDIIGLQQSLVFSRLVHVLGKSNNNIPFELGIGLVPFLGTL